MSDTIDDHVDWANGAVKTPGKFMSFEMIELLCAVTRYELKRRRKAGIIEGSSMRQDKGDKK